MRVIINGKNKDIATGQQLDRVISAVSNDPERVIAEVNGQLIKTAHWTQTSLQKGDTIELAALVGGG